MLPTDGPTTMWVADTQGLAPENLDPVVDVLIAEFAGQLHDTIIIDHVVVACQQLFAAGVFAGLATATESMARARLRAVSGQGATE